MSKKSIEITKLSDFCYQITTIECSNCKQEDISGKDEFDSAEDFYTSGWRVKNEKCLCPDCCKIKN